MTKRLNPFEDSDLEEMQRCLTRMQLTILMAVTVVDHLPEWIAYRFSRGS